uniref:Uncharacterized protein n=1 Tax=Ananas comosus var. bracteatus TaxID=296719 RepID=A0A6V7QWN4_ANACO
MFWHFSNQIKQASANKEEEQEKTTTTTTTTTTQQQIIRTPAQETLEIGSCDGFGSDAIDELRGGRSSSRRRRRKEEKVVVILKMDTEIGTDRGGNEPNSSELTSAQAWLEIIST